MRDYGWEMEPLVNIAIDKAEYLFHNGLIQNAEIYFLEGGERLQLPHCPSMATS